MGLDTAQLLANIRKRKAELNQEPQASKKQALDTSSLLAKIRERKSQLPTPPKTNPYLNDETPLRRSKPLIFNQKGKYIALAEAARKQKEISDLKASLASAFIPTEPPKQEWWDDFDPCDITNEIWVPAPIDPPADRLDAGEIKAYMTKREMKRMRKHDRYEKRREAQDRIRLGLDPPPPPKISQKNVVAVIGAEYYADPTKFDVMAAQQVAKRRQRHEETNAANKLDAQSKWEKHVAKVERDKAKGLHCAVIKFSGVVSGERRYILDAAANKLLLAGVLLCTTPFSLAIVEGGGLEVKKFKKLAAKTNMRDDAGEAQLIWQGELRAARFKRWSTHAMPSKESKELLQNKNAQGFWDLAEQTP